MITTNTMSLWRFPIPGLSPVWGVCRRSSVSPPSAVALHWLLVAVMCFWSFIGRLSYGYTTTTQPNILPQLHTHAEPPPPPPPHTHTHTYSYTHVYAYIRMRVQLHTLTYTLVQIITLCSVCLFNPIPGLFPKPRPLQLAVSKQPWHCRDLGDCGQRDGHKAHWTRKIGSNWEEVVRGIPANTWRDCLPEESPGHDKAATNNVFLYPLYSYRERKRLCVAHTTTQTVMSIRRLMNVWRAEEGFYRHTKKESTTF